MNLSTRFFEALLSRSSSFSCSNPKVPRHFSILERLLGPRVLPESNCPPREVREEGESFASLGQERTRWPGCQPSVLLPHQCPLPSPPSPGQRHLKRLSPLPAAVIDGFGSRRFERNSLGRCLYCVPLLHAQTSRWLRQCEGKLIPFGIHGKEVSVGYPSSASCLPTKEDNRSPRQKAGFFMSIINAPSYYEILTVTVSDAITLLLTAPPTSVLDLSSPSQGASRLPQRWVSSYSPDPSAFHFAFSL